MARQRLTDDAKGVFIISATPFNEDDSLDLDSADRLVDFYLEQGVDGLTILGVMGEAPKLTFEESVIFVKRVLKRVKDRVPVVVGVTNPGNANLDTLTRRVMDEGAAGVMIAPIPNLHTDEQIYNYFKGVFTTIGPDVPVVLQDYPPANDVYVSVPLVNRLFTEFPQIAVFKHEDCPGLTKITRLRQTSKEDGVRRVSILVGNGGLYYVQELMRGADGAMTGFAFPEMLVKVYALFAKGDVDAAEDLYDAYLPLTRYEQQPGFGLAVRKYVLYRRGVIKSPTTRKPGPALDKTSIAELERLIGRLEKRLKA